jgi:hypothetical protein
MDLRCMQSSVIKGTDAVRLGQHDLKDNKHTSSTEAHRRAVVPKKKVLAEA